MAPPTMDTEPGQTTPGQVRDMRQTSDIRIVMIELATVKERVQVLIEANKDHRSDFRLTWTAFVAGFLILAGLFIYGYNRVADKIEGMTAAVTKADTKIDDILLRLTAPPPAKR